MAAIFTLVATLLLLEVSLLTILLDGMETIGLLLVMVQMILFVPWCGMAADFMLEEISKLLALDPLTKLAVGDNRPPAIICQ